MVEAHLSDCESCAAIFTRELNFLNAVRESAPLHVAPPELRAKVQKIVSEGVSGVGAAPVNRQRRASRMSWLVAAAAALLLLLLPLLVWRVRQSTTPSGRPPSSFALMAAETHLRHVRGNLPLE